jgi:hypothetical protein
MGQQDSGYGHQLPGDTNSELGVIEFACRRIVGEMNTTKLVKVIAVHDGGEGQPAGTVDVQPLVSQIDGNGYGTPHGTVYGLPWSRVQGGTNAIICDPVVGDLGYVVCSDRDISTVKSTKAAALPGSRRQFDIADGVYAGGCLNVAPEQYLIFTDAGVRLVDKNGNSVTLNETGVQLSDEAGNSITTSSAGVNITDVNANQLQMVAGFVNIVTPVFKVNGTPVIVP